MSYTGKAAGYAQHRWNYARAACDYVAEMVGLSERSVVADIGAGTGMLTEHFSHRAGRLIAIEPDPQMRAAASVPMVDGRAEATTLPDHSIDLIVVGRALHWFPAPAAHVEFKRILRSSGWLAVLSVRAAYPELTAAVQAIKTETLGWNVARDKYRRRPQPFGLYFGHDAYERRQFPSVVHEQWPAFFGRLCSYSVSPPPSHPRFAAFERAAHSVFERFCSGDSITIPVSTEVVIGQVRGTVTR